MRNCDLCSNYGSLGTQAKWEQNSQFLVNSEKLWHLLSGKKLTEHMESELSGIFLIKTGCQKWCLCPKVPILCICKLK